MSNRTDGIKNVKELFIRKFKESCSAARDESNAAIESPNVSDELISLRDMVLDVVSNSEILFNVLMAEDKMQAQALREAESELDLLKLTSSGDKVLISIQDRLLGQIKESSFKSS